MAYNTNEGRAEYIASAGQTLYTYAFKVFDDSNLKVYSTPAALTPDDTRDLLTITTDYTVTINGDAGGTITLLAASSLNDKVTITRDLPITRNIEYQQSGDLSTTTLNLDQDYQTYMIADKETSGSRSLSFDNSVQGVSTKIPTPVALNVMRWNINADALENIPLSDNAVEANVLNVDSIADLPTDNTIAHTVNVRGYYLPNDGGGGIFNYDATQSAVDNGGTIINGWVRQGTDVLTPEMFGAIGDGVADDLIPIQNAVDTSTSVDFSKKEYLLSNNLNISTLGTILTGKGGAGIRLTSLKFSVGGIVCTVPQLRLENIGVIGASDIIEKGSDTLQIGVKCSAPSVSDNLDYTFSNCTFAYFNKCVEVNGRNIRITDSLFSNSNFGVHIPSNALADIRGLEFYNNRLHSMTKTGVVGSCIHIEAAANFTDAVMLSNYADDCGDVFTGFASNSTIDGMFITKGRKVAVTLDATSHGVTTSRRTFNIFNASFQGATTTIVEDAFSVTGTMIASLDNVTVVEHGGNGIKSSSNDTSIKNCRVTNAGQALTDTYYGIVINGARNSVGTNTVSQDVPYAATNNMKAGFSIGPLAGSSYFNGNTTPNMAASYELDLTVSVYGILPVAAARKEFDGTAAPTTGTWSRGDKVWDLAATAGGTIGWVCTATGAPGTWKTFGTIAV